MKRLAIATAALFGVLALSVRAESSLGFGARLFRSVDSLPHQYTKTGAGAFVNWRAYWTELVSGQIELDFYEEGYAGSPKEVLAPQAFLLLGRELYGGFGAGLLYSDGNLADQPFLILRAGYQWAWGESLTVDLNASYEYGAWKGITKFTPKEESDTIAVGLGLRLDF